MNALLRLERVVLRRGGRLLFDGLDLALGPGEALLVTGPNGSGKSSLLRLAAGLLHAQAGRVERGTAALADDGIALDPELPLRQALGFWARLTSTGDRTDEALAALGLAQLGGVPVRLLSAGQAKRAALARLAASGARLWLLDEPLNGLDRDGVSRLDRLLAEHRSAGGGVVAASHVPLAGDWARLELGAGSAQGPSQGSAK